MIRYFLASRLIIAFTSALALGWLSDSLAAAIPGAAQALPAHLFLFVALAGFFIALVPAMIAMKHVIRPKPPPFGAVLAGTFIAAALASVWLSFEFGAINPVMVFVLTLHSFLIYGTSTAVLFRFLTQPPTGVDMGWSPAIAFSNETTATLAMLPVALVIWGIFFRRLMLPALLPVG